MDTMDLKELLERENPESDSLMNVLYKRPETILYEQEEQELLKKRRMPVGWTRQMKNCYRENSHSK